MIPTKCAKITEFFDSNCAHIVDQLMPHIASVRFHIAQFENPSKSHKSLANDLPFPQMPNCNCKNHKNAMAKSARKCAIELVNELRRVPIDDQLLMAFCCALLESGCCLELMCTMMKLHFIETKKLEQFAKMNAIGVGMDIIDGLKFQKSAIEENDENGANAAKLAKEKRDFLQRHSELLRMKLEETDKVSMLLFRWDAISWQMWKNVKNESVPSLKVENLVKILLEDLSAHSFDYFCVALLLSQQFNLFNILKDCANLKQMQFLLQNFVATLQQQYGHQPQQRQLAKTAMAPIVCALASSDRKSAVGDGTWQTQTLSPIAPSLHNANLGHQQMFLDAPEGILKDFKMSPNDLISYYNAHKNEIYPNFAHPRGLALVINNYRFAGTMQWREGTQMDEENIVKLLDQLKYKVLIKNDLTAKEMMYVIKNFARQKDSHQKANSAIVVVFSHGEYDTLWGTDEMRVDLHEFVAELNAQNCPQLIGKPKIFIIQACRGDQIFYNGRHSSSFVLKDFGVHRSVPVDSDCADGAVSSKPSSNSSKRGPLSMFSRNNSPRNSLAASVPIALRLRGEEGPSNGTLREKFIKEPSNADFLIAQSTPPHFVSWRSNVHGSWFVRNLCKVFSQWAAHEDIHQMLTRVNYEVSTIEGSTEERAKQVSELTSTLRKRFFFFV